MPTYQEIQQALASRIIASLQSLIGAGASIGGDLAKLINAMPPYGDQEFNKIHRGAIMNLFKVNLPNHPIDAEPESGDGYCSSRYFYKGPYSGYRHAFFGNVTKTDAASTVAELVRRVNPACIETWWANYGIAVLTDAIRLRTPIALDKDKLTADLSMYYKSFLLALSASFLAVFQCGYDPTANALSPILRSGQGEKACKNLSDAIKDGQFTANINQAISMGGDSTNAAVWFLFNLWITLAALGSKDVDGVIRQSQATGLNVPPQVGPGNWWNVGYISWFMPISGTDLVSDASGAIDAPMPEIKETTFNTGKMMWSTTERIEKPNGYSQSFCRWGSLSRYKPPDSSCFGKGTGVLMADGTVRPIERMQIGDEVASTLGPRKVSLVETPKRSDRPLFRLNGLNLYVTSAHPLRAGENPGPLRRAIEPWTLMDGTPTMVPQGVGRLEKGRLLAGMRKGVAVSILVEEVEMQKSCKDNEECVYDFMLEGWSKDHPAYFVGGPGLFFAADAETADPLYHPPSTRAIVAAMETALPHSKENLSDPVAMLPRIMEDLNLEEITREARNDMMTLSSTNESYPRIPGPEFYMNNGSWDVHASMLEFNLVRYFARTLRRESETGWRAKVDTPSPEDHLALTVHDIELIGDAFIPPDAPVEILLNLQGRDDASDTERKLAIKESHEPLWFLAVDEVIDFGSLNIEAGHAYLAGTIRTGSALIGQFRAVVSEDQLRGRSSDHFIFSPNGDITGRISIQQRRSNSNAVKMEQERPKQWSKKDGSALAVHLGRRIGFEIRAHLRQRKTRV